MRNCGTIRDPDSNYSSLNISLTSLGEDQLFLLAADIPYHKRLRVKSLLRLNSTHYPLAKIVPLLLTVFRCPLTTISVVSG